MPSFSPYTLANMAQNTVKMHLADELAEQVEFDGLMDVPGGWPMPRAWKMLPDLDDLTVEQSPLVAFTVPGLVDAPVRMSGGQHKAVWALYAYVFVRGMDYEDVRKRVMTYTTAIRTTLARWRVGATYTAKWVDEDYRELPSAQARTLGGGYAAFAVEVSDVLDDIRRDPGPIAVSSGVEVAKLS